MTSFGHTFGGSALDRLLFDYETVADSSAATGGAPAGDGPSGTDPATAAAGSPAADGAAGAGEPGSSSAGATEAAPAWTPEQIAALREHPDFQSFLSDEAAAIADARFEHLLARARGGQQQPTPGDTGGGQVDLNEFLDPYGDNFGANLASVLGGMLQQFTQTVDQRMQPFTEQTEQAQQVELDTILKTAVTDHAGTLGGLRGGDQAVQRVMSDVRNRYMPEAMQLYGNTDRAAQHAIDRAVRAELAYQQDISGGAAVQTAEHLAELTGARGELPVGASGVVTLPDKPLSNAERVAKYGRLMSAARG